jgi:hypothetical protein
MKTFLNLIPWVARDAALSLSLAAFSFMIYLSNFRTIGFICASVASVSKWANWGGGFSYGPRLLAEI